MRKWFLKDPIDRIDETSMTANDERNIKGERGMIDTSLEANLNALLADLQEGFTPDDVMIRTVQYLADTLTQVREILGYEYQLQDDVKWFSVAPSLNYNGYNIAENITPQEEDSLKP